VCDFCARIFGSEDKLLLHMCEPKRRHQQRDEKPVKLAFIAYQQFYRHAMRNKAAPTYQNFAKSNLYLVFVRFGRYLLSINAVNPIGFVDFLLKVEVPIDKWISPTRYETYIRELNKNETPQDALERNIPLFATWAHDTGHHWRDFFRKAEPPLAALWISSGRISPWILFIASSAHDLMQRLQPDQAALIERSVDPEFWKLKIKRHQQSVDSLREILAKYGM
jgi:hypothetical protein